MLGMLKTESNGLKSQEGSLNLVETMRSFKSNDERLMYTKKQQIQLNAQLLQTLTEIQKQLKQSSHKTNDS
jgi:hypothetical protein